MAVRRLASEMLSRFSQVVAMQVYRRAFVMLYLFGLEEEAFRNQSPSQSETGVAMENAAMIEDVLNYYAKTRKSWR